MSPQCPHPTPPHLPRHTCDVHEYENSFLLEEFAGHFFLAQLVQHAIIHSTHQQAATQEEDVACTTSTVLQGAPLLATGVVVNPNEGNLTCAMGVELERHVLRSHGWRYTVERSTQGHAKPGFVAFQPGAELDLCFTPESRTGRNYWQVCMPYSQITPRNQITPRSTRLFDAASMCLQFAYLTSWARQWGVMEGSCHGGCTCATRVWDSHLRGVSSQPMLSKLIVRQSTPFPSDGSCPCVIRLTSLNRTRSGRQGHKFKLTAIFTGFAMAGLGQTALEHADRHGVV